MPVFFQHQINEVTRLGIWKIEETEAYFRANVPLHREVTHPHKRLQHLAGRFLLQYLFPDFPYELIKIADTRKPFLPDERYHFSISHCGDYAAALVSRDRRVGIDIEMPVEKIMRIRDKFLSGEEKMVNSEWSMVKGEHPDQPESHRVLAHNQIQHSPLPTQHFQLTTLLWSAKEAVFKWYGEGAVDFRGHIRLQRPDADSETIGCFFSKTQSHLAINYRLFDSLVLAWVTS